MMLYDASLYENSSILVTQGGSVVIRYGNASRTLAKTTTSGQGGVRVGDFVIRGGDAAFSLGPRVSGSIISGQDPYVVGDFPNGKVQYQPVTAQTVSFDRFSNRSNLYFNQQYAPLEFGSAAFPVDASGLVGGITFTTGADSVLVGSIQNLFFPAIPKPTNPVNSTNSSNLILGNGSGGVPPVDRPTTLQQQPQLGEAGQVAQQVLNKQAQNTSCEATSTIAAAPSATSAATTANTPCASAAQNDAQILKILGE
jgi:hypothetical protein